MNYFAHAFQYLDDPHFAVGTGVPDWLSVVDRTVRVRLRQAEPLAHDPHAPTAAVARGIAQHLRDDARFHETRAFMESMLELTVLVREVLGGESGFRTSFLGHLLVEVLLDASLISEDFGRLETYYEVLGAVDFRLVEEVVNRIANQPTDRLAWMIGRFWEERILWDYLEDGKLLVRLNQVMRRVGLALLPDQFGQILPDARRLVDHRKTALLDPVMR